MGNDVPRIVSKEFILVGINHRCKWGDDLSNILPLSTNEVTRRITEIKTAVNPQIRIRYFYSETGMEEDLNYLESVEVTDDTFIPDGFMIRRVKSECAVFSVKNSENKAIGGEDGVIGAYARKTWLPTTKYQENYNAFGDLQIRGMNDDAYEFWLPIEPRV